MSLLGTQVYANTVTPNWVGVNGGTVRGPLEIAAPNGALDFLDASGNQISRIVATKPPGVPNPLPNEGLLYLQSDYGIAFSQQNQATYNTVLNIDTFNGEDLLDVGGQINTLKLAVSAANGTGMSGFASIPLGQTNVVVPTTCIDQNDMIFFTRVGPASAGPGNGISQGTIIWTNAEIVPQTSFVARLVNDQGIIVPAVTTNADFYWMIIKTFV